MSDRLADLPPGPAMPGSQDRPPESADRVAAAYDAVAAGYDDLVREDFWMRERLWAHYLGVFGEGARVLDVACGTGLDTLHLAALGRRMTGVDASPGMVAELRRKAAARGLAKRLDVRVEDAACLDGWSAASFDGILSSFAGVNTVDLPRFAAAAARLLRPRGRAILHLLAPAAARPRSWWLRSRLGSASPHEATPAGPPGELSVVIGGHRVRHARPAPADLYHCHFAADFALRRWYGLGWLWPRRFGRRCPPALLGSLGRLDAALGRWDPFRGRGRFFVIDLERR
jgi:ubiquinone/menaquinone biosynthesis C-methylase UbiE